MTPTPEYISIINRSNLTMSEALEACILMREKPGWPTSARVWIGEKSCGVYLRKTAKGEKMTVENR